MGYVAQAVVALIAVIYLVKESQDFKELGTWGRFAWMAAIGLTFVFMFIGMYQTYQTDTAVREAEAASAELRNHIDRLRNEHRENTIRLLDENRRNMENSATAFARLHSDFTDRFSDLRARVQSDELRRELDETRKALQPPKAVVEATFHGVALSDPPRREITLFAQDNVVPVQLALRNTSETTAADGSLDVAICEACEFATEPSHFRQVPGSGEKKREHRFQRILPRTTGPALTVDIRIPEKVSSFTLVTCPPEISPA